jgi:cytochrome c553
MVRKLVILVFTILGASGMLYAEEPVSKQTQQCLGCHSQLHPGIVAEWKESRHAGVTPGKGMEMPELERRISAGSVPDNLRDTVVGCYECHGLNGEKHADNFEHFGFKINVVVSPNDCAVCHPVEVEEYTDSKKGQAYFNLADNPVYSLLVKESIGIREVHGLETKTLEPSEFTKQETCYACHGTKVEVKGLRTIETKFGPLQVPDLTGWPNQGVGRLNPDGSVGACTSCHARHSYSIEVARKPHTCGQCHLEPDVPAYNVYKESKHGNIYESRHDDFDFENVPWVLGEDFTVPTCATCHVSLVVAPDGSVIAERSHDFGARLWVRLFGLIYTHPQPRTGNTSGIRNKDGQPLPTTFAGEVATEYLIDEAEQAVRKKKMTAVCNGCHNTDWIEKHFEKMDNTLRETDAMTRAATQLMQQAWEAGVADPSNPFDETLERQWIRQWLFYGNSIRYASAMTGAQDYAAFKNGWWYLSENLEKMRESILMKMKLKELSGE